MLLLISSTFPFLLNAELPELHLHAAQRPISDNCMKLVQCFTSFLDFLSCILHTHLHYFSALSTSLVNMLSQEPASTLPSALIQSHQLPSRLLLKAEVCGSKSPKQNRGFRAHASMPAQGMLCCCPSLMGDCVSRYHNQTGVEIRPYDWGGLEGVAALDPDAPSYSGTYSELLKGLQAKGYTAKKDLFGAPFDFRLNAEALQQVSHQAHDWALRPGYCDAS